LIKLLKKLFYPRSAEVLARLHFEEAKRQLLVAYEVKEIADSNLVRLQKTVTRLAKSVGSDSKLMKANQDEHDNILE
jgi:hypothetical protein